MTDSCSRKHHGGFAAGSASSMVVGVLVVLAASAACSAATDVLNSLTLTGDANAWIGLVDVKKSDLIITNAGTVLTPAQVLANYKTVNNQVGQGAGFYGDGAYDAGTGGITSSSAVSDPHQVSGVGVIQGRVYGPLSGSATFGGVAVDTSATSQAVLVGLTAQGDAAMQGFTDFFTDYFQWQQGYSNQLNFGQAAYDPNLVGWEYGDFNGDGTVDFFNDYFLWQTGYTAFLNGTPIPTAPGVVPEPATLVLLGLGAVSLLKRRSTKRNAA